MDAANMHTEQYIVILVQINPTIKVKPVVDLLFFMWCV